MDRSGSAGDAAARDLPPAQDVAPTPAAVLPASSDGRVARAVHVRGVVQGVGFRPFVHRLALELGLTGRVRNESGEVRIEVEGDAGAVAAFVEGLSAKAPPLARIDALDVEPAAPNGAAAFDIVPSTGDGHRRLPVSPDVALCAACEAELFDPANRRYHYPFITCTDCGPRYTVIGAMPYDRERTSMGAFTMCPACAAEYAAPGDRRHHSQTNSCPVCGPRVWLVSAEETRLADDGEAIEAAARLLRSSAIVAVRGLGGFHLAAAATDEAAVARLRRRKARETKPLAVMVRTLEQARAIVEVDESAAALLGSPERPVVVLRALERSGLAPSVAPGLPSVGVMLAYTPLHHLLLDAFGGPLVMTSGNMSEEPIATGNREALERLSGIADALLLHDRDIVSRYDDSVLRPTAAGPVFLRRARGYAPLPVPLPLSLPVPLLAVGPHLKNTFALAQDDAIFVSQHIGDLENLETLGHFRETLGRYEALFHIRPQAVAHDRHPDYLSTRFALDLGLERTIAVQHHHAHIAAVAAEHGVTGPVVGIAYDGTGYGDDGRVWGAEVLVADLAGYRRAAHLRYAPLPGGDLAARRPWRAALGYLTLEPDAAPAFAGAFDGVAATERRIAEQQTRAGLNAPLASSMGRLFDAAAAVLGIRRVAGHEGHAAMELEGRAGDRLAVPLPFPILESGDGVRELDPVPLLVALGEARARGEPVEELAARFHESVAAATAELAARVCADAGLDTVALGGGVFQNARLLSSLVRRLEALGLRVLVPRLLSPNDGAISYGQAAVAAALLRGDGSAVGD